MRQGTTMINMMYCGGYEGNEVYSPEKDLLNHFMASQQQAEGMMEGMMFGVFRGYSRYSRTIKAGPLIFSRKITGKYFSSLHTYRTRPVCPAYKTEKNMEFR